MLLLSENIGQSKRKLAQKIAYLFLYSHVMCYTNANMPTLKDYWQGDL
jgi:hypothetical protein